MSPAPTAQRWTEEELEYVRTHTNAECVEHLPNRTYHAIARIRSVHRFPSGGKYHWTDEEDNFIKANFEDMSVEDIAKEVGHTVNATRNRMSVLHLLTNRTYWTPTQIKALKDMCSKGKTIYEIAEALGRSPGAVRTRCGIEGAVPFYETPDWAKEDDDG